MQEIVKIFNEQMVRIVDKKNEPWFVAKDVCNILGLTNSRKAVANLDDDEKGVTISDTPGGPQSITVISESGLYKLIMRSRKPEAQAFVKWITAEILPSIRRDGSYVSEHISDAQRDELIEKLIREKVAAAKQIGMLEERNRVLSHFEPTGTPGDISSLTGRPKLNYRRGCYTSGRGPSVRTILARIHPDLPGMLLRK